MVYCVWGMHVLPVKNVLITKGLSDNHYKLDIYMLDTLRIDITCKQWI